MVSILLYRRKQCNTVYNLVDIHLIRHRQCYQNMKPISSDMKRDKRNAIVAYVWNSMYESDQQQIYCNAYLQKILAI